MCHSPLKLDSSDPTGHRDSQGKVDGLPTPWLSGRAGPSHGQAGENPHLGRHCFLRGAVAELCGPGFLLHEVSAFVCSLTRSSWHLPTGLLLPHGTVPGAGEHRALPLWHSPSHQSPRRVTPRLPTARYLPAACSIQPEPLIRSLHTFLPCPSLLGGIPLLQYNPK